MSCRQCTYTNSYDGYCFTVTLEYVVLQDGHWKLHPPSRPPEREYPESKTLPGQDMFELRDRQKTQEPDDSNPLRLLPIDDLSKANVKQSVKRAPVSDSFVHDERRKASWVSSHDDSLLSDEDDDAAHLMGRGNKGEDTSVWDSTTLGMFVRYFGEGLSALVFLRLD